MTTTDETDGARPTPGPLTERQQQILDMIRETVAQRGYPPTVREIGDSVGLRSPSSVHAQLANLERSGHLRRDATKPRAMEILGEHRGRYDADRRPGRDVPLLGEIAAGAPILAEEQIDDVLALPESLVGDGTLFALRVRGESMIEAGIMPGDVIVVRQQPTVEQGEMCAALIDGEATVKFFRRNRSGEVFLDPANAAFEPISVDRSSDASILGKVTAVLRSL